MAWKKRTVDTKAVNSATEVLTQIAELATVRLDDAKWARVVGDPTNDGLCPVQIYGDDPSKVVEVMNATPYIPAKGDDCYVYCVDNNLSSATAFIIQIRGKDGNFLQKLFANQINEALANWTAPASNTSSASGPSIVDTWRPIQVNGASWKSKDTGSSALNFKAGTNISLSYSGNDLTINATGGGGGTTYAFVSGTGSEYGFGVTPTGGSQQRVTIGSLSPLQDTRTVVTTPSDYSNNTQGILSFVGIKNKAAVGNPSTDAYAGIIGMRTWGHVSSGSVLAWEFATTNTGLFARKSKWEDNSETWDAWKAIYLKPATGIPIGDLAYPNNQGDEGKAPVTISTPGGIDIDWVAIPSVTLNGSTMATLSFYAPTGGGTSGQILLAGGTGTAPSWASTISGSKLALANGNVFVGNSGGVATEIAQTSLALGVSCVATPSASGATSLISGTRYTLTVGGSTWAFETPVGIPSATASEDGYALTWNDDAGETDWSPLPSITLNGTRTLSPSFYAPTGGGTSGQILLAGGTNTAPSWSSAVLSDANALYPNGQIDLGTSAASWDDAYLNTVLVGSGGVRPTTSATASTGATLGTDSYKWRNLYSYGANLTLTPVNISDNTYASGARVAFIDHNGQLQKTAKGNLQTWLELKDLAYVSQPASGDSKFLYYDYDGQLIWTPAVSGIRSATSGDFDTGNFELIGGTNVTITRSTVSTSTNDIIRYTIAASGSGSSYTAAAPLSIDNNNQISLSYGGGLTLSNSQLSISNPVPALPSTDSGRKVLTALWSGAPDNYYSTSWESPVADYAAKLGTSGFALVAENGNELNFACSSLVNDRVQIGASGTGRTTPQSFVFGALATSLSQAHGSASLLASSGRFGGDLWTLSYDGMSWINVATEIYNLASGMAAAGVSGIRAGDNGAFSGGNIALIPGNDISITKRMNGSVTEFVFSLTCLIKGTKILMADGTERPIEQIQVGDEIASWDINTQQRTTAIVTSAFRTGCDCEYTTHLFDDGSYIVVYGKHSVYNKTLGYPTDISKFREGDETYNAAGEVIHYAGNMRYYVRSERVPHYDLNSSNNLYFANGILNGKNVFAKYRAMKAEYQTIPASIQAVLDQQERANAPVIGYETDPQYFAAIASAMKERFHATRLLEEAKKHLADTDYIVNKWTEGLITAVEWLKAKTERASWRENVNTQESALASIENKIKGIQAKFHAQDTSVKDRFEQFSALDNAALNEYRKWLSH